MTVAFPTMFFLILSQFFILHYVSASSWQTLSGKPPVVIARGGFSGVFPDSSSKAYELVSVTTSLNVALWCDLQLTKDGVGICSPNLNLYNYSDSYDPTAEYLSFIDNGNFSVDGFLSDFQVTPYRAISCFSHLDTKKDEEPATITIISKDGASGDFPGCTDLAYEKAVKDGVDILDCNAPFCMSSIDLLNTTYVFDTSFRNLSSTVSEIQRRSGIHTFSLTMSQIKTLKPVISNPKEDHALFRIPRNKNAGKFLTLSEFLFLANRYNSLLGVLIKVENAVYLAEHQGIRVVDAVLNITERLTTQEGQTTSRTILFQSIDKSVLMEFNEKKLFYHDVLVHRVDEDIHDVTDSAIKDIMSFARYRKSQCYREMGMFRTSELIPSANPMLLPPAQAPYPSLVESDVMEPPLPEVRRKKPPAYAPTKAIMVKAIKFSSPVRTIVVLVIFFISV